MRDYPDLPVLPPKEALRIISSSSSSLAQKLLASSLVTEGRSFEYTMTDAGRTLLILDVTHFLNHRINTKLVNAIGEELALVASLFQPELILTAPSSGNIPAVATALYMNPMPDVICAPKGLPVTIDDAYFVQSRSYTHGTSVTFAVAKDCLPANSRVLICDDFLDTGRTGVDLTTIVGQAGAVTVGFCFVIEKPFGGRQRLIDAGFANSQIVSLMTIDSMRAGMVKLKGYDYWFALARQ